MGPLSDLFPFPFVPTDQSTKPTPPPQHHTTPQEFTPLAAQLKAVNLGQGFPDWPTPRLCKEAAKRAIDADFNQVRMLVPSIDRNKACCCTRLESLVRWN